MRLWVKRIHSLRNRRGLHWRALSAPRRRPKILGYRSTALRSPRGLLRERESARTAGLSNVDFLTALRAAFVPRSRGGGGRRSRLRIRLRLLGLFFEECFDFEIGLVLGTLGMHAGARVAGLAADRAELWPGGTQRGCGRFDAHSKHLTFPRAVLLKRGNGGVG